MLSISHLAPSKQHRCGLSECEFGFSLRRVFHTVNQMSTSICDDDDDDEKGTIVSLGSIGNNCSEDLERSTVVSSSCDEELLETEHDDATLAESIIRTRTSFYRADANVASSRTSTGPVSSTEFELSSRNDSTARSHTTFSSNGRGANSLSGFTAHLSDDDSASPVSPRKKIENVIPVSENFEKRKNEGNQISLRWSSTVEALPTLPKDALQAGATQVLMPPLDRTSTLTVSTVSMGPSDRIGDTSLELVDDIESQVPGADVVPIVAVPVPTNLEPVEAVAVSIVQRNEKIAPKASRRRFVLLLFFVVVFSVIASAVFVGVCGSGGCASSAPVEEEVTPFTSQKLDDRKQAFYSFINNLTYAELLSPLQNDTNPELQALNWLIYNDPLQLVPQNDSFRIRQRYALLTIWFHSENTFDWVNSTGWLDYDDECTWFGISCSNIDYGPKIGLQMTVTAIDLGNNAIKGIIPSDLGLLSKLLLFSVESNQYYGSIPESIGRLTDLKYLLLGINGFMTGQIPESIGNLDGLVVVDFSYNLFTGQLPPSIGNWTDAVHVDFSGLPLIGTLPNSVGNWINVEFVGFMMVDGDQGIHGTLPESIGNWVKIRDFFIGGNDFSGFLPSSISFLTNLRAIDLSFNEFTGTIPEGVVNWTNIEEIYLFETFFTGSVPESFCMLSNLTTLEADCLSKNITCSCCTHCN